MAKLFAVTVSPDSDMEILIEAPRDGAAPYAVADDLIEKGATTLSAALDIARSIGQCANEKLRDLDAEITVGLKLSAKGKFIVAEAGTEATITVKFRPPARKQ
jgi:hypothetical protein